MSTRTVIITGAARRGGATIARRIHGRGYRVILHCRASSFAAALELAADLNEYRPESAIVWPADLSGKIDPPPFADDVCGIVASASEYMPATLQEAAAGRLDRDLATHLQGHFALIAYCEAALRRDRGAIVAITDIATERAQKGFVSYLTAKGALEAAMKALAAELAPDVRVNCVAPGPLEWPENGQISDERKAKIIASTPLARTGTYHELATAVEFLLFDATFTTGVTLPVDGGRLNFLES